MQVHPFDDGSDQFVVMVNNEVQHGDWYVPAAVADAHPMTPGDRPLERIWPDVRRQSVTDSLVVTVLPE
ncbi:MULTISPECIES: MbtH family NRPS accessory protein [unclassified Mycobacterium]|uniref:MbtH family NRPS accessory protein n=1 Tax=unclassified Mycobacterium TaxID=2642494 RepID=UPI00080126D8|nr:MULTISPECIES: MbtH family NRPS accessory protein [unclassified Mycobacterium]OBG73572.1 hypothetical protein A5700_06645 [Mycobacterium sp. E1214]OBH22598.1 hypothetical protein A5693_13190 [Mycobacterium sp. E1319]